jgi:hypothetical protein
MEEKSCHRQPRQKRGPQAHGNPVLADGVVLANGANGLFASFSVSEIEPLPRKTTSLRASQ